MITSPDIVKLTNQINEKLVTYPDKEWHYSRISLDTKVLTTCQEPYVLWCDTVDPASADGKTQLKALAAELKWGDRHSNELGILEIISLRLNKALAEITSDDDWPAGRPVLRIVTTQSLVDQGITTALTYRVTEVAGEEFDNR